jgi:hypothetical protein
MSFWLYNFLRPVEYKLVRPTLEQWQTCFRISTTFLCLTWNVTNKSSAVDSNDMKQYFVTYNSQNQKYLIL